jgi:hypothetical protein
MRRAAFALTLSLLLPVCARADTRVHSDALRADLVVSCTPGPVSSDYTAETASGVALTDPYAVARGADKGLVRLMDQGGRRTKRYVVPHDRIRAIVRVKYDGTLPDWADLVFTPSDLIVVRTSTANAGIFTGSDVYQLPFTDHQPDLRALQQHQEVLQMTRLGLSVCRPEIKR